MTLPVTPQPEYVEEVDSGLNLNKLPAFIDDRNKYVYCISDVRIFVFNAKTGKRLHILPFTDKHLAVYANDDYCVSVTSSGVLLKWDLQTQSVIKADSITSEGLTYVYNIPEGFYCVTSEKNTTTINKLILDNNGGIKEYQPVGSFSKTVRNRKQLAICDDFAVVVVGKINLELLPFNSNVKPNRYVCRNSFANLVKQNLLAFDAVYLVEGTLYASLNIGRLLFWKLFDKDFFSPKNLSSFHRHPSSTEFIITNKEVLYAGGGEAVVNKWNLAATGNGRWQKPDSAEKFDAPISCLSISKDGSLLIVQLEDNTIWVLQTTSMNILCEFQSMQWNAESNWLPLVHDPTRPDLIVTGGRIGHIQWFDPTKWRTVAFFDVTNEDTPSRDNLPYGYAYDWLNVYCVNLSPTTIVTVERRRNRKNAQSYIKFFRRNPKSSLSDVVLEDTIEWHQNVVRVISSNDDLSTDEAFASLQEEEIVVIDKKGLITVFIRDVNRSGRWLQDLSRSNQWMSRQVISASKIRNNCFATVHTNQILRTNHVVLWNLVDLTVYRVIDEVQDPRQAEWAPMLRNGCDSVLIIKTPECIVALDLVREAFLWVTMAVSTYVFSTSSVLCCYNRQKGVKAYAIDPLTGEVEKEVSFSNSIQQAVVTTSGRDLKFIGMTQKGGLQLLKIDNAENEPDKDIVVKKKTPFSELVIQQQEQQGGLKPLKTFKEISIKSRFDLPVYASAPLTRIGPEIIQECFIPREEDY